MKKDVFNTELSRIKEDNIRYSTELVLESLPDYFYVIPASSSGKYHPKFSLGEGGLVRHVKAACKICEEYFRNDCFNQFDDHKRDLIRMSIILHDGFKSGIDKTDHTVVEHPLLMSNFILLNSEYLCMTKEDANDVARLISSHMGPWVTDKQGNVVLPKPVKDDELFVHNCDYLASRAFLDIAFENNEIVDSAKRILK